jgi:hypothetical protein
MLTSLIEDRVGKKLLNLDPYRNTGKDLNRHLTR